MLKKVKQKFPYLVVCGSEYTEAATQVELLDICDEGKEIKLLPPLNIARQNLSSICFDDVCYVFSQDTMEYLKVNKSWRILPSAQKNWKLVTLKMPKISRPTLLKYKN